MNPRRDIYFIEETCPLQAEALNLYIRDYAETIREAYVQNFNKVRYENGAFGIQLTSNITMYEYCQEHLADLSVQTILLTQAKPYIDEDSEAEEKYVEKGILIANINEAKIESYSLSAAYLNHSIGIGFKNNNFTGIKVPVEYKANPKVKCGYTLCITEKGQFDSDDFIEWAEKEQFYPNIQPSKADVRYKRIHLSAHHGNDELKPFAKRLIQEYYINEVLNSIDRDSLERKLIHALHDNVIELRLLNGHGYGLVVSTTARNKRELRYIAMLLENKYGRG